MKCEKFDLKDFEQLKELLIDYRQVIGEKKPSECELVKLKTAIQNGKIAFFVAKEIDRLVAMCSVSIRFSTYNFSKSGMFEDFYVKPGYRSSEVSRELTKFVMNYCKKEKVESLWVGCGDIDEDIYEKLGFNIPLGNLMAMNA